MRMEMRVNRLEGEVRKLKEQMKRVEERLDAKEGWIPASCSPSKMGQWANCHPLAEVPSAIFANADFDDQSWGNDAMPRFEYKPSLNEDQEDAVVLWVDYKFPKDSEFEDERNGGSRCRYSIAYRERELRTTDSLEFVLEFFNNNLWQRIVYEQRVLDAFVSAMQDALNVHQWKELVSENAKLPARSTACASHNYMDANEVMQEAFHVLPADFHLEDDEMCSWWNSIWEKFISYCREEAPKWS